MIARVCVMETIAAPAAVVYDLLSDLPRMGEWSPESTGGRWLAGGGPVTGGRFVGRNQTRRHRWSTLTTVTAATPGQLFAFRVTAPVVPISDWEYRIESTADGCRVEETWIDLRPSPIRLVSTVRTGVADRVTFNRQSMKQTLAGLKATAESTAVT